MNLTGQVIDHLIVINGLYRKDLAKVLNINSGTRTKVLRDEKSIAS